MRTPRQTSGITPPQSCRTGSSTIDFICLGDPRQSDIDIRQILGRGLRWNKQTYPNKLLHLLVPLYKNEFGEYSEYGHLKKYLDYIIVLL